MEICQLDIEPFRDLQGLLYNSSVVTPSKNCNSFTLSYFTVVITSVITQKKGFQQIIHLLDFP